MRYESKQLNTAPVFKKQALLSIYDLECVKAYNFAFWQENLWYPKKILYIIEDL